MLTTVKVVGSTTDFHKIWQCICDCGNTVERASHVLRHNKGGSKSCGCMKSKLHQTHGMRGTPTYNSWHAAKYRCLSESSKDFDNYGGRGISMCKEWIDSFEQFYLHMGNRPDGTSLERLDPNNGYIPGNCVWATPTQQSRNKRNSVFVIGPNGRQHLSEVAEFLQITYGAAFMRLKRGKLDNYQRC